MQDILLASLRNEIEALKSLSHAHILTLADIIETESHTYIVTELLGRALCKDDGTETPKYTLSEINVC
jgi:serine/threonine protein kinase